MQDKRERRLVRQQRLLARHPTPRISSLLRFQRFLCEGILRLWEAMLDQVLFAWLLRLQSVEGQ